ncbi:TerC family protein [Thermoactinomyces sp. CICC 10521]|uniref:TerC family protein n=2 Tax=Thermoactinomycetaceae TaxID=186824 RepID=A0A7W1XC43_9BACL|nr:TerC family protein [Thermoactinomyces daqus]MBH8597445.1 TerC family protein [Thermoactinomyces sp. CICC 10523]MBH8603006.1 TerC family protein [Thermoactinomyces sp. CICC 10522]MBH8607146.1 TerC family protein [Thermoactinomyces sp. CICC 10521]
MAFWIGFFNIIILDLLLSGDNAVVIGMAARNLPEHQRKKAVMIGAGMAVILRASLTAIAAYLLKIPLLMTIGGILLLWIAVNLLADEEEGTEVSLGRTLKSAIKTIIVADVVMSLDNVLAVAGAAHGSVVLVLFGLALSIPIIMWGSGLVASLLKRLPWLIYAGTAILGYTAGELMIGDPLVRSYLSGGQDYLDTAVPIVLAILVMVGGHVMKKVNSKQKTA